MKNINLPLLWFLLWLGTSMTMTSTATPITGNKDRDAAASPVAVVRSLSLAPSLYPRGLPAGPKLKPRVGSLVRLGDFPARWGTVLRAGSVQKGEKRKRVVKLLRYETTSDEKKVQWLDSSAVNAVENPLKANDKVTFVGLIDEPERTGTINHVEFDTTTGLCTVTIASDVNLELKKVGPYPRNLFKTSLKP